MNWSLLNIGTNFTNLRYSVGIAMMFNGFPLIFFIRDTLKIGPANSIFTAAFLALGLILMIPRHIFKRLYKPNTILFNLGVGFLVIMFYYFMFINFGGKAIAEIGNFVFIFGFLILLLHIPNDVSETLVTVLFVLSLFANVTLVYSLLTDPNWTPGMRAAVSFSNDGAQPGGNPHITARNGVVCLISGFVLLSNTKGVFTKIFLFFSILFSLGVVVISLAKSSYIGIGLMLTAYFIFHFKVSSIFTGAASLFKFRNLLVLVLIVIGINAFLNKYGDILNLVLGYWDVFQDRIMDVIFTSFGVKLTETADVDYSAMGRVSGFGTFLETAFSWDAFLGRGYKSDYLDVPILESFVAYGIIGFLFFALFNLFLFLFAIREIRRGTSEISTFLAYFFVSLTILLITGGRPTDIAFWFPYAVMIRFLGIRYLNNTVPERQEEISNPVSA
ncbi:hypothetical protein [Dyadobacter psychrotolerans]|uniref:O-antigen ligase domain-containing protein n=1 Tax=Dyadobacter psychrotolerans TaxID=2541721 RepID=A0A4R5DVI9_9BACT|nr:hypothetical protein [Dyadobacter psychrotolerans]TDE16564.1 hypothetical protein E0F88_10025 [Dyadobacter psychrotolerans]